MPVQQDPSQVEVCGIYVRISRDRRGKQLGVQRQETECRARADSLGWTVHRVYKDNDRSATSGKLREEFAALLADLTAGIITRIIAWDEDRLFRRMMDCEQVIALGRNRGLLIATVACVHDVTTSNGRMFLRIKATAATWEVEHKVDRSASEISQAIEAGRWTGGRRPMGYLADGKTIDPDEGRIVVAMYERFLSGATLGSIARWLNESAVTTPRGNRWKYHSVRTVLENPRYAGLRGVRRLKPGTEHGNDTRERFHEIIGPAEWDGLVDETTWRAVIKIVSDSGRRDNYLGNTVRYLLSQVAYCGVCGQRVITGRSVKRSWSTRTLRCPTLAHVSRRADYVEELVTATLLERLRQPSAIELTQPARIGPDIGALRSEAGLLHDRLGGLAEDYATGILTREQVRIATAKANSRLTEVENLLAQAGRVDLVARVLADMRDPAEVWPEFLIDEQRRLVDSLMVVRVLPGRRGRVPFDPRTVKIEWRDQHGR